jgi:hypothetical protein
MTKTLKSALHHWWPRSLSGLWADADGCVTQLSWDGHKTRSKPSNFGAIKNAHHMKFGESNPWNTTFEHIFSDADNQFADLAEWLLGLDAGDAAETTRITERLVGHSLSELRRSQLATTLASLIVRSPRSRNNIKLTVEHYRKAFDMTDYAADKTLIAGNMVHCQPVFARSLRSGGKFLVLSSVDREFIFGDGFLHNFPPQADPPFSPRCIIPLLPTVTVLFARPASYWQHNELVTLRLTSDEVELFNTIVQVYSRDAVFYRSQEPRRTSSFRAREFLELEYHQHPWIEQLIAVVAEFRPVARRAIQADPPAT